MSTIETSFYPATTADGETFSAYAHTFSKPSILTESTTETVTVSYLYCPPPLTNYNGVCATVGGSLYASVDATATSSLSSTSTTTSGNTAVSATGTAGTTTVAPYKGGVAGRVSGAIGGALAAVAVGAAALWML